VSQPRRTHPLSPLIQAVPALPAAALFFIGPGSGMAERSGLPIALVAVAGAITGYAAFVVVAWLGWWRRTYWIDGDGDLRMDSGVLQRSARRLQLSRLQSVDVAAPVVARVFGLVEVRVEVAGVGDSRIVLRYLTRDEATALRAHILELSRGSVAEVAEASDRLASVPSGRLLAALLLRSVTVALFLASLAFIVITSVTQGPAGLLLALITGGLPIVSVASEYLANYGFRIDRTHDGLRIRRGLLSTQTRTVPPDRVHAVGIVEPLLWRHRDWVRVTLTIAGVRGDESRPDVLIPVAPRAEALRLIAEVLPGVDVDAIVFDTAPRRARWRSPLEWRRLACAITPQVIVARSGRITRRTSIALHARVQSVRASEGPWERRLGLATLYADTAPGPVQVAARHLAVDQVTALVLEESQRMRQARQGR
jgi:putative membrane protein